jgi:pimeloyl-ACP methyl ester carboxylesterase
VRSQCGDIETAWYEVGSGPPLVLVHGLGDDHRAWRRTLPDLMLSHRVVLYDLRGHGGTSLGSPAGTLHQLGADLASMIDALELGPAVVAGFSLGGTIAMRLAIDHPDKVAGLVLVATSSRVGKAAAEWYGHRFAMVAANDPDLKATIDRDTEDVYRHSPEEIAGGLKIRRESTADPRGYGNACRALAALGAQPLDPELTQITSPTLVVTSDLDELCPPRAAEIVAAGIRGSRVHTIKGAGHPLPVERPAELARLIVDFTAASR